MKANSLHPGDGIGTEVVSQTLRVTAENAQKGYHTFTFSENVQVGGCSIRTGSACRSRNEILTECKNADAVPARRGGRSEMDINPPETKPEKALLGAAEKELELYCQSPAVKVFKQLISASPLKPELLDGVDILVFRELTGGIYFGPPRGIEMRMERKSVSIRSSIRSPKCGE